MPRTEVPTLLGEECASFHHWIYLQTYHIIALRTSGC